MSERLKPGMYAARLRSGLLVEDDPEKAYVAFVCEVLALVASPRDVPLEVPLTRTVRRYLTEKASDYTIKDLRSLGWAGLDFGELKPGHPRQHDFAGTPCKLLLRYKPYQGQDAAKAGTEVEEWEFRLGGGGAASSSPPASDATVARINAAFRAKLAAAPAAPRPQQAPPQQQAYADDDKIPF